MHDLGDLLGGGDAVGDLAANRALAHRGHEVARHPEVDVGFQQGHADFAQGGVDVALAKAAASAEVAKYAGEPLGQTFKHRVLGRCAGIRRLYGARVAGQSTARFRSIGSVGGRSARGIRLAAQDTALSRRRSRVRIPHALPKRSCSEDRRLLFRVCRKLAVSLSLRRVVETLGGARGRAATNRNDADSEQRVIVMWFWSSQASRTSNPEPP